MQAAFKCFLRDGFWNRFIASGTVECYPDMFRKEEELQAFMSLIVSVPVTLFDPSLTTLLDLHQSNAKGMVEQIAANYYDGHTRHFGGENGFDPARLGTHLDES